MTNREYIIKERADLIGCNIALDLNGNICKCSHINCTNCKFYSKDYAECNDLVQEFLDEEYEDYHILTEQELKTLPIDTKVEVCYSFDKDVWVRRYYSGYNLVRECPTTFANGATSWSGGEETVCWRYVRLPRED